MAWTSPMTAADGSIFTAAQFNTNLRDNLLMTAPGIATTAGQYFVATAANAIAARATSGAGVLVNEATTSQSYTDLATPGPTVSGLATGTAAFVFPYCWCVNSLATNMSMMSVDVSGASTVAPADSRSIGTAGTTSVAASAVFNIGLTAGSNTFTAKYRVGAGTGTFNYRRLEVLPL